MTYDGSSGSTKLREINENAQQAKENLEHENSRREVPAEYCHVSPEQQRRLESPEQHITDEINQGKYGEGFQVADNTAEQSVEEEYEMEM